MQQKAQRAALRLRGARPWAKAPNFPAMGDPYLSIREYSLWRYFNSTGYDVDLANPITEN
jgi:hypothetical protein